MTCVENMYETSAIALSGPKSGFEKIVVQRNETGPDDIEVDIKFCGICHSDVHFGRNEFAAFMETKYPCVPGHELAGVCAKVLYKKEIYFEKY